MKTDELENVVPPSILYSIAFPLGFVTLIVIEPVSSDPPHSISSVAIVKSGSRIGSTVIEVLALQLLASITVIS